MIAKNELLRVNQVVELVHIAKSTVWLWVSQNRFPKPVKIGKCTFWKLTDIQAWIAKQG